MEVHLMERPVPKSIRDLPTYRGLPVPFTVLWVDGVPDFKVTDPAKVALCVSDRLCGMCGLVMGDEVAFIGGDLSLTNRLFTDPAMHEECARFALTVCLFLLGQKGYAENPKHGSMNPDVSTEAPERIGLLITDGWEIVRIRFPNGTVSDHPCIHAHEGKVIYPA
jgi:hypothetical protein